MSYLEIFRIILGYDFIPSCSSPYPSPLSDASRHVPINRCGCCWLCRCATAITAAAVFRHRTHNTSNCVVYSFNWLIKSLCNYLINFVRFNLPTTSKMNENDVVYSTGCRMWRDAAEHDDVDAPATPVGIALRIHARCRTVSFTQASTQCATTALGGRH